MQAIAWDEIGRLVALGLPACVVVWTFHAPPGGYWGYTYPVMDERNPRPLVLLEPDLARYSEDLDRDVRTTVRHEFGHALTHMLGLDDAELRVMFPGGLEYVDEHTMPGFEASAEAIAQALTPQGQERAWFYDADVDAASVEAARELLASAP